MPKVSVMLPSYNHGQWLQEAIESVLNQTFTDLELIIVDDGSGDNSPDIIRSMAKQDQRIKFDIFHKNRGAVHAVKRCYELSEGEFLALTSSDDVWYPYRIEKQIPLLLKNNNLGVVFGLATHTNAKGKAVKLNHDVFKKSLIPKTRAEWMNFFFTEGNCLCHHSILIRKRCYEEIGFYKPAFRMLPDLEMWTRLFYAYDVCVLNEELIKFRRHNYNESGRKIGNQPRASMEYKQILRNFLTQIRTVKELEEIFPNEKFPVKDDRLAPFYWAHQALNLKKDFASAFAFDVLYEELSKSDIYNLVESNNLYSHRKLSEDVVRHDIYGGNEKVWLKIPLLIELSRRRNGRFKIKAL